MSQPRRLTTGYSSTRRLNPPRGEPPLSVIEGLARRGDSPPLQVHERALVAINTGGDFERLVRSLGRPATRPEVPDASRTPTPAQAEALAGAARECHIDLIGAHLN
jgi:hypothetical protein